MIDWERSGSFAVTPDGRRAVSSSYDKTLWLWELGSGKTIRTLEGHTGIFVSAVAVTPDGRRAVSALLTTRCGSGTWRVGMK